MRKEIHILILEDVAADVVRINHELRQAGMNFRSKRVERKADFLHELQHRRPDVILSDHGLPSFDGFTALAIARDKCPDIPFIFVTGSVGEEMAIETFKSGATDYVLKSQLSGLAPAVERALRESEARVRLRESEQEVHQSEERFRLVMEGIKDYAIFMLDLEGRVTFWNAGAQWIVGWRADDVKGRNFSMFYTDEDAAKGKPRQALKTAANEGRFAEEAVRVGKGGKRFIAEVAVTPVRDATGRLRGYTQVTRNITARKEEEQELRRGVALKTAILDTALDGILSIDHNGLIQEWNPAAEKIFGYRRDEVVGRKVDDLIIPASLLEIYRDGVANYLVHGASSLLGRPIELSLRRADGSEFRAEMAISRVPTEEPPRCTALIRDITERKKAETALRESEELYRMLVEDMKDYAIYMVNPEGRIMSWNTGAERIEGYPAEEIIGQPWACLFTPEDIKRGLPAQLMARAKAEGKAVNEGWRVRKDGSRFWTHGVITALRDENGQLRGYSKLAHDITRQREADERIHQLNEELEQRVSERTAQLQAANQELEAFSYSISHDLRAPLLRISGFAEILQSEAAEGLGESSLRHLRTIAEAAQQLSTLIDALLDFSRMGRAELHLEKVDMSMLVEDARRELQADIQGREIEWRIGDLPGTHGDPLMLRQVFINLLANAIKYTRTRKPARIEIAARREGDETTYSVQDNGVGFDMQYAEKLFGVFQRLHSAQDFEGTGIGLANVRRIIRRHGGRVWAEGLVDHGATFYFTIPQQRKEGVQ